MQDWLNIVLLEIWGRPLTMLALLEVVGILILTFALVYIIQKMCIRYIFPRLELSKKTTKIINRTILVIILLIGLSSIIEIIVPQTELLKRLNQIYNFQLFSINETSITASAIFKFLMFLIGFAVASRLIRDLILNRILHYMQINEGTKYTFSRIIHYIVLMLGIVFAFHAIGVNLSGLAVVFGFLSVGIGFGLQNVTSNFIAGLILLFERPIQVGDRVLIGDIEGDVDEIKIRATRIQTPDNISIIVPNSEFVATNVINYSHGDSRMRINIDVGVSYNSDLDAVIRSLKEVAAEEKMVLKTPKPDVLLRNFGDSAWDMRLRVWINDAKRHPDVRSMLNCAIVEKFRKNNIEIPYPQRDLNFRNLVEFQNRSPKSDES